MLKLRGEVRLLVYVYIYINRVGGSARTLGVVAGCVGGGLVGILLPLILIVLVIQMKRRQKSDNGESLK